MGYTATGARDRLDRMWLCTEIWEIEPRRRESICSSYFADEARFPNGRVEYDSAFLMRYIPQQWQRVPDLHAGAVCGAEPHAHPAAR